LAPSAFDANRWCVAVSCAVIVAASGRCPVETNGLALSARTAIHSETFKTRSEQRDILRGIARSRATAYRERAVQAVALQIVERSTLTTGPQPCRQKTQAFSFQVATDNQEETDRYWNAIVGNGGEESQCGWCKDRWGVSWQITPRVLIEAMAAGGNEAKRAFAAMMPMKKIAVAAVDAARRG
jgi:predicted 3-demethylubiquinone-9 3-methyltransferase (glyoxalase superfamily)